GGAMGQVIDASGIQFRMLNRTKGPAMHSPRAQADKKLYQLTMKHRVEAQPGLTLRQEVVEGLLLSPMRNAECGMRNEESPTDSEQSRAGNGETEPPAPSAFRIPHSAFRIECVLAQGGTVYRARA